MVIIIMMMMVLLCLSIPRRHVNRGSGSARPRNTRRTNSSRTWLWRVRVRWNMLVVVVLFEKLHRTLLLWCLCLFSLRNRTPKWERGFGILIGVRLRRPRAARHGWGHEPGADLSDPRPAVVRRRRRRRRGGGIGIVFRHDLDLHLHHWEIGKTPNG